MEAVKVSITDLTESINRHANALKISYIQRPKPDEQNWKSVLESYKISHSKVYELPPVCLEFVKEGKRFPFASLGNVSTILGKTKSRKTFSMAMYLAAAMKKDSSMDLIQANFPPGKSRVVLADTEQAEFDVSVLSGRIRSMAGEEKPSNFDVYSFRAASPEERIFLLEKMIYDTDDLGLLVIDGIRDLVSDINSCQEATSILAKLMKWSQERHIHIMVVIHENKGNEHARGHLGTELVNKSEAVISVEKIDDISVVRPVFMRGKDFEPFAFGIDGYGIPYIIEDWIDGKSKGISKPKLSANNIPDVTHLEYLKDIFSGGVTKKYKDLLEELGVKFQTYNVTLNHAQLVAFIAYYRLKGFVKDTGSKGRAGNQYTLN